jgi:hypothetical protein
MGVARRRILYSRAMETLHSSESVGGRLDGDRPSLCGQVETLAIRIAAQLYEKRLMGKKRLTLIHLRTYLQTARCIHA